MKRFGIPLLFALIACALIAARVSAVAAVRAQGNGAGPSGEPNSSCSLATLRGPYGGLGTGTNVANPDLPPGPFAIVNVIVFDGHGRLVVPVETMSFNGDVRRLEAPVEATYTVAPDCTGALRFGGANVFDFVIVGGGNELLAIHAAAGFVHTVVLKRQ